jgi:hypothetical protein
MILKRVRGWVSAKRYDRKGFREEEVREAVR